MAAQRVISADSHMTEPGDLWVERLDRQYRDHAPRVIKNEKPNGAAYLFVGPGSHPLTVAFYVVSMLIIGSHLWHGASSALQSLGFDHPSWTPRLLVFGRVASVIIAGGFIVITLFVYFTGGR